jgi:phage tail-like protein
MLYPTSPYRVWFQGRVVAGFQEAKIPGRDKYGSVTLERGVTHDVGFADWARGGKGPRDLKIERLNSGSVPVSRYNFSRSWVSTYPALPNLNSNANAIAIEHIKIEVEGFERDTTLPTAYPLIDPPYATGLPRFR